MTEHITAPAIDKSNWPAGPWHAEPDRVEFEHAGHPCLIVRHPSMGHLCGYVAVAPGHPWHGVDENEMVPYPECHGGATYASKCADDVCHVAKPGESDDVWWIGFDAAHSGDLSPKGGVTLRAFGNRQRTYKTVDYMRRSCELLAEQAAIVGKAA